MITNKEMLDAIQEERHWVDKQYPDTGPHWHRMNEIARIQTIIGNIIRKSEGKPFPGDYIHKKALMELLENAYNQWGDDYGYADIMKDIEDIETDADVITLRNAMENPLLEIVQAGEPERKIFVKMTYTDLVTIKRMITKKREEES